MAQTKVDVVVTAGSTPGEPDPLAEAMEVERKALIEIAGKEMIRWVVDALRGSSRIGHIFVVGLSAEDGVDFGTPVEYVPAVGKMLDNIQAGIERVLEVNPDVKWIALASSDIPLLTTEIVDYFLETCEGMNGDIFYSVVERKVMEARFPGSGRTFVPLREGAFCGGDLFLFNTNVLSSNRELWDRLSDARKNFWRQVSMVGFIPLIKLLLRRLTIAEAERVGSKALNCRGRAFISAYAEVAMDVDKPHQLDMARAVLEGTRA